jgi:demethylmenaquinone methyltransferase / 2-methoxy-6-polyprenyl-1,4-benzoquinol methylase
MTPGWQPFRGLYLFYFRRILPLVGRLISRHGSAYDVPARVGAGVPGTGGTRTALMEAAGFVDVGWDVMTGGIVAAHHGTLPR